MEVKPGNIGIFFGSSTGNCHNIAELIRDEFLPEKVDLHDIHSIVETRVDVYQYLIFGVSTWGNGEMQEDWASFMEKLERIDLSEKCVAIYGLGDQATYPESFVDGMEVLYQRLKERGCRMHGYWGTQGYTFLRSKAVVGDKFLGMVIDEESQYALTRIRIKTWVGQLKQEFGMCR